MDTLILFIFFLIIKIIIFRGDLSGISAKTATLVVILMRCDSIPPVSVTSTRCCRTGTSIKIYYSYVSLVYIYNINQGHKGLGKLSTAARAHPTSVMVVPVLPFPKLNKTFFGYFDPENIFFR